MTTRIPGQAANRSLAHRSRAGCGLRYWKHAAKGHAFYTTAEDHQRLHDRRSHAWGRAASSEGGETAVCRRHDGRAQVFEAGGGRDGPSSCATTGSGCLRADRSGLIRSQYRDFSRERASDNVDLGSRGRGQRIFCTRTPRSKRSIGSAPPRYNEGLGGFRGSPVAQFLEMAIFIALPDGAFGTGEFLGRRVCPSPRVRALKQLRSAAAAMRSHPVD